MKKIVAMLLVFVLLISTGVSGVGFAGTAKIKITDDYLRVRSSASLNSDVLGYVMEGEEYTYSDKDGQWYQITVNGKTGWVHADYVKVLGDNTKSETAGTYTVVSGDTLSGIGSKYGISWQDIYRENNLYTTVLQIGQELRVPGVSSSSAKPSESNDSNEKYSGNLKVTDNWLNVRSGAGTSYRVIGQVNSGDQFEFVAKNKEWYKIKYNSDFGWVHGNYVEEIASKSEKKPSVTKKGTLVVTDDYLRVRSQASTSGNVLLYVMKGNEFDYVDKSGKWYKVEYADGEYGWIYGEYTKDKASKPEKNPSVTKKGTLVVTDDYLRVRSQASTSGSILSHVMKGNELDYFDKSGKWYKVEYLDGKYGWIYGEYTKDKTPKSEKKPEVSPSKKGVLEITDDYLRIRSSNSTSSKILGYVMLGQKYDFFDQKGSWYKISYESNKYGWVYGSYVKELDDSKIIEPAISLILSSKYVENNLPIQISASTDAKNAQEMTIILDGKTVVPWGSNPTYIYTNPKVGKHNIVIKTRDYGNKNAKEFSKSMSFSLEKSNDGHSYQEEMYQMTLEEFARSQVGKSVTWKNGGWNEATYEEILAEIDPEKILEMKDELSDNESTNRVLYIDTDILNVRKGPSTNYGIITQVSQGERYEVLASVPNWYKIRVGNQVGYVYAGYTAMDDVKLSSSKDLGKYIMVATDGLNFRTSPSLVGKIITELDKGYIYPVIQVGKEWTKIKVGNVEGYVSSQYIVSSENVSDSMYQFLNLQGNTGISSTELDKVLENKGILEGRGKAFVEASRKYNINEMYLISHALLETGNGSSTLAKGVDVKTASGNTVRVYNMYGIGAFDNDPIGAGSQYALDQSWTNPDTAIIEGAKWIANNYVNNRYKQNTLYKMKWNYKNTSHQYATDVGWARKQTYNISNLYNMINGYKLEFILPNYAE